MLFINLTIMDHISICDHFLRGKHLWARISGIAVVN